MYAKLVFPSGTNNTDMCRDIARAVSNSNGAGGSTVGALEFVDAGSSTIDDTVAANWTLASGYTIATGASVEQDKELRFQQTHANGSIKTVAVRIFNKDVTGFTKSNDNVFNSVVLRPVSDHGEAYESTALCPADTSSTSSSLTPGHGVSAYSAASTVHVIARDKVIALAGERQGNYPNQSLHSVLEAPTQYENNIGRNKPAQTMFWSSANSNYGYSGYTPSTKTSAIDFTSTNIVSMGYQGPLNFAMFDTLHERDTNQEVRMATVCKHSFQTGMETPSTADPSYHLYYCSPARDITEPDGWTTSWTNMTSGQYNTERLLFPPWGGQWAYSRHAYSFDPSNGNLLTQFNHNAPVDKDGNPEVKLFPIAFSTGNQGGWYDFGSECGLHVATNNIPRGISILNDGTDNYVAIRTNDSAGKDGAVVLKV